MTDQQQQQLGLSVGQGSSGRCLPDPAWRQQQSTHKQRSDVRHEAARAACGRQWWATQSPVPVLTHCCCPVPGTRVLLSVPVCSCSGPDAGGHGALLHHSRILPLHHVTPLRGQPEPSSGAESAQQGVAELCLLALHSPKQPMASDQQLCAQQLAMHASPEVTAHKWTLACVRGC